MDIEKLIEQLKNLEACAYGYHINGEVLGMNCSDFEQVMVDAADEIANVPTLRAENEKLRAELEKVKRERDAAVTDLKAVGKGECWVCKHFRNGGQKCRNCEDGSNWEWRGQKED